MIGFTSILIAIVKTILVVCVVIGLAFLWLPILLIFGEIFEHLDNAKFFKEVGDQKMYKEYRRKAIKTTIYFTLSSLGAICMTVIACILLNKICNCG